MEKKQKSKKRGAERVVVTALAVLFFATAAVAAFNTVVRPPAPPAEEPIRLAGETDPAPAEQSPSEEPADAPAPRVRKEYCYTILLSGLDDDNGGSDTNILVRFDAVNRTIDLVSLPRDTLLDHEWRSNKLNYAYALGGTDRLRSEISNLLGVPVDFSVTVGLKGFVRLIDRIGGVDFNIPVDMDYDDPYQDLHIHFSKGMRHLTGQEALEVVRWRKNNDGSGYATADIGRIGTQQKFLKAVAQQLLRVENVPALAETILKYVKTDLDAGELAWLGNEALGIGMDGVAFHTLPGDGAASYRRESVYALDPEATLALVNEALNPYTEPLTMDDLDILVP